MHRAAFRRRHGRADRTCAARRLAGDVPDARRAIEALSWKVGLVLVVLGAMHFFNLYVFSRLRRRGARALAGPGAQEPA
jgi:hypothetical protein